MESSVDSPQEPAASPTPSPAGPDRRDRIVVLGRTQAGKTIYLATLYYLLWSQPSEITVRALDGRTHKACIEVIDTLRKGEWPSSTTGSRYLDLEVTYQGQTRALVSLDYPGEVFRKAFIEGAQTPDVEELLDHVDRAAAVIILIDPGVAASGELTKAMDDDFGMLKAVERIRSWPGGEEVPVTLVLTKYDVRKTLIQQAGGLAKFVRGKYAALARAVPGLRVYACSAVQQSQTEDGPRARQVSAPLGVVPPLLDVLKQLERMESVRAAADRKQQLEAFLRDSERRAHERRVRAVLLWTLGWLGFVLLFGLVGLAAWWAANR